MLFQRCDSDGSGLVKVDILVDFIRSVQMGTGGREGEQEYDSHIDVKLSHYLVACFFLSENSNM